MIDLHFLFFVLSRSIVPAMGEVANSFGAFSQAAAPMVVTALWQGAVLAIGLGVCLRLAKRASAAHRFVIWAVGFAALVCLPLLPLWMSAAGGGSSAGYAVGAGVSSGPLLQVDLRWTLAIGGLWIVASIVRAVALGNQMVRLRRLWKGAMPIEGEGAIQTSLAGVTPRSAQVCTTKELDKPAVIGFFAPRILIPEWLFARLTREELEHVILHESEHLRRHDDWMNLAQKVCLVVFPLNPALAWMDRRLASEREMACDEGVVRATKAPRAYAASLASLAERGLKHKTEALALGAWQRRPELVERVHRILRRTPGLSPVATRALVGAMTCGLVFGSIEFARCPQLVAFVPAQRFAAQQVPGSAVGDARFVDASYGMNRRNSGARAVDVVARMPDAGRDATPVKAHGRRASNAPREILLKAEMPSLPVAQQEQALQHEQTVQPELIVFTAWEQVEGSGRGAANRETGLRRDYEADLTPDGATAAMKNLPGSNAGNHITMTRLILKIYPTGAGVLVQDFAVPEPHSVEARSPELLPPTNQPAMIPIRDGWFVFQL